MMYIHYTEDELRSRAFTSLIDNFLLLFENSRLDFLTFFR